MEKEHITQGLRVDSYTALYGVFGDPVRHSRSPIMLGRAFAETGTNAAYVAFHVKPEALGDAVRGVRSLGLRGVNVTVPHKVEVMQYLDEIDETARVIGAVNTIVNRDGRLVGYNTDGIGYVRSLKEETGRSLRGARILLLGAGGASRGVGYALAKEEPARLIVANRTEGKASELARELGAVADTQGIGWEGIDHIIGNVDIIINTTPIGMHPNTDATPIDPASIRSGTVVSDLIYNPLKTKLLVEAEAAGLVVHGGLGMFVYQGAYAFEYWTGLPAPVAAMREAVLETFEPAAGKGA
ncbi:shikimate dehydrogenase [Paenibacillus antri]|uniref:shikimate dehydrogenase n=1 Tax=Paenibacillus antri TaxID=2582848 RepID=UPI001EE4CFAD|nr:shikimate dehydrogenase [Paenibacillus antri]